jgi:hypothetical protein
MQSVRHRPPYWQMATLATVAALWVALSIPLILGRGGVEAYLLSTFKDCVRADAFVRLNRTFVLMWIGHTCLLAFCIVAMIVRESDLFTVLIIGPILALLVAVTSQQWADPDWNVFAGVCFIGWLVGNVSGGAYCLYRLCVRPRRTIG